MSGHSKWSTIKHKKAAADAKRGKIFTRYIRELTIAARGGADPDGNPRLRAAIAAAKGVNMPKENIERAILRGSGGGGGAALEEVRYEGYGQGGVAILVDCVTDNRKRTVSEVRSAFSKGGGSMGETGCVSWMFHQKGQIIFDRNEVSEDEIMEVALDAGAEDIRDKEEEGCVEVLTDPADFVPVKEALEAAGFTPQVAELSWIPENLVHVEGETAEKVLKLIERLEELDDVQQVSANYDISEAELERING
ncbi:MAG: YebC/PmpR family DNA-binding transcriptional regulator [Zetaproteobacteria bacterium]|nr:MAG: YebC/PmpR family DNA-binding transcriptional regulator [Zetaproteobacteria bacterium]